MSLGKDVSDPDSDPRKMEIVGGTSNCKVCLRHCHPQAKHVNISNHIKQCQEPPVFPKLRTGMIAADTGGKVFFFVFRVTSFKLDLLHPFDVKPCLSQVIICGGSESNQILVPEKDCWHLETLDKHPLNGSHFQQKWDNKDFLELLEGLGQSRPTTGKA